MPYISLQPIFTDPRLRIDAVRLALLNPTRNFANDIKKDFEETTKTWQHKPKFETAKSLAGGTVSIRVWTEDKIWNWVDQGTAPHPILAGAITGKSKAQFLDLPLVWSAKTKPGVLGSFPGARSGHSKNPPQGVMHPGIEAREFTKEAAFKWEPIFMKEMQKTLNDAAQKSGFGMK